MSDADPLALADAHWKLDAPTRGCEFYKAWKEHSTRCNESGMTPENWCDVCRDYWTAAELRRLVSECAELRAELDARSEVSSDMNARWHSMVAEKDAKLAAIRQTIDGYEYNETGLYDVLAKVTRLLDGETEAT